jgi:hypothetical protein
VPKKAPVTLLEALRSIHNPTRFLQFLVAISRNKKTFVFFSGYMEGDRDGGELSNPETF